MCIIRINTYMTKSTGSQSLPCVDITIVSSSSFSRLLLSLSATPCNSPEDIDF
jgi:hypothetical protein